MRRSAPSSRAALSRPFLIACALLFALFAPLAQAQSATFSSPSGFLEDAQTLMSLTLSSSPFNGTITLWSTNAQLSASQISFTSAHFSSGIYNATFYATPLDTGLFMLYANVSNASSGSVMLALSYLGEANSSNPRIISSSPQGMLSTSSLSIGAITDEQSTCRASTSDIAYASMTQNLTTSNGIVHNLTFGSVSQGAYTYYVRCQDSTGHAMNSSHQITALIDSLPSATLSLEDESPIKAGTLEITLALSESVPSAPILQYSFDDSSAKKPIALTGSGTNWKGYLIITESDNARIGTFFFSATDSAGNTGTQLSGDTLFIVDTQKPITPSSIKATPLLNGHIELEWFYDGEETESFAIYRSTDSSVSQVDFYAKASRSNGTRSYVDTGAQDKVTYYYRVSAIDTASNEGALSDTVYATSLRTSSSSLPQPSQAQSTDDTSQQNEAQAPRVLPPGLHYLVSDQSKKIEKVELDIDNRLSQLSGIKDPETSRIAADLGISDKLSSARNSLSSLNSKTAELKSRYATKEELTANLLAIDEDLRKIEITTPAFVSIREKGEFTITPSKEEITYSSSEVLKTSSLSQDEQSSYISLNAKAQKEVIVSASAHILEITYLDGSTKESTIIRKKISYAQAQALSDVVVMEFIPKSIAASVNEITFLSTNYEVVEEDPIVKFGFLSFNPLGEEVAYTLNKAIALDEVKNSKTVMLLSPSSLASNPPGFTGFAIFNRAVDSVNGAFFWVGLLTIVLLGGYYAIALNGFDSITRTARRQTDLMRARTLGMGAHRGSSSLHSSAPLSSSHDESTRTLHEMYSHIDKAKKDAAHTLIPALFALHEKLESQKNPPVNSPSLSALELAHLAHLHLERNDHEKAQHFYSRIHSLYPMLPKEQKAEVYAHCVKIREKIESAKKSRH